LDYSAPPIISESSRRPDMEWFRWWVVGQAAAIYGHDQSDDTEDWQGMHTIAPRTSWWGSFLRKILQEVVVGRSIMTRQHE
jgi:hypothetical protein